MAADLCVTQGCLLAPLVGNMLCQTCQASPWQAQDARIQEYQCMSADLARSWLLRQTQGAASGLGQGWTEPRTKPPRGIGIAVYSNLRRHEQWHQQGGLHNPTCEVRVQSDRHQVCP